MKRPYIIFLIGISAYGVAYYKLKHVLDDDVLFATVSLAYVVALRLAAEWIARRFS